MIKSLTALLALLAFTVSPAQASEVTIPAPHKTVVKTGAACHTPMARYKKECAQPTSH